MYISMYPYANACIGVVVSAQMGNHLVDPSFPEFTSGEDAWNGERAHAPSLCHVWGSTAVHGLVWRQPIAGWRASCLSTHVK